MKDFVEIEVVGPIIAIQYATILIKSTLYYGNSDFMIDIRSLNLLYI